MKQILLLLIVPFAFLTALSAQVTQEITPIQIDRGMLYGAGGEGIVEQSLVITNKTDWDKLKAAMNSVNNVIETEVDFSVYQVVAVFDKVRPNLCYGVEILTITEYTSSIDVTVKYNSPGPGFFCADAIGQPYHIVKIPVSNKEIRCNGRVIADPIVVVEPDCACGSGMIRNITPVPFSIGNHSLYGRESVVGRYFLVTNQTELDNLKVAMECESYAKTEEIDFSEYQVIAAFGRFVSRDGCQGGRIYINITEYADNIAVCVYEWISPPPPPGTMCIQIFNGLIYNIVKIPVSNKPVIFCGGGGIINPPITYPITDLTETENNVEQLYPNPVGELLTIPCNGVTNVEIYDLKGNRLYSGLLLDKEVCQLNVSFLNAGIYMVNVSGKTYKMIKN